jgi:hypothetical protein
LISFSLRLVSDQSFIGSGVASVRRTLPRLLESDEAEAGRRWRQATLDETAIDIAIHPASAGDSRRLPGEAVRGFRGFRLGF